MTSAPDNIGDGRPKSYVVLLSDDGQVELPKELLQQLEDSGYDARPGTTISLVAEGRTLIVTSPPSRAGGAHTDEPLAER